MLSLRLWIALLLVPQLLQEPASSIASSLADHPPQAGMPPGVFASNALAARSSCAWNAQGPAAWDLRQGAQLALASVAISILIGWGHHRTTPKQDLGMASADFMTVASILKKVRARRLGRAEAIDKLCALPGDAAITEMIQWLPGAERNERLVLSGALSLSGSIEGGKQLVAFLRSPNRRLRTWIAEMIGNNPMAAAGAVIGSTAFLATQPTPSTHRHPVLIAAAEERALGLQDPATLYKRLRDRTAEGEQHVDLAFSTQQWDLLDSFHTTAKRLAGLVRWDGSPESIEASLALLARPTFPALTKEISTVLFDQWKTFTSEQLPWVYLILSRAPDPQAMSTVCYALLTTDIPGAEAAALLERLGEKAATYFEDGLTHPDATVAQRAKTVLRDLGKNPPEVTRLPLGDSFERYLLLSVLTVKDLPTDRNAELLGQFIRAWPQTKAALDAYKVLARGQSPRSKEILKRIPIQIAIPLAKAYSEELFLSARAAEKGVASNLRQINSDNHGKILRGLQRDVWARMTELTRTWPREDHPWYSGVDKAMVELASEEDLHVYLLLFLLEFMEHHARLVVAASPYSDEAERIAQTVPYLTWPLLEYVPLSDLLSFDPKAAAENVTAKILEKLQAREQTYLFEIIQDTLWETDWGIHSQSLDESPVQDALLIALRKSLLARARRINVEPPEVLRRFIHYYGRHLVVKIHLLQVSPTLIVENGRPTLKIVESHLGHPKRLASDANRLWASVETPSETPQRERRPARETEIAA